MFEHVRPGDPVKLEAFEFNVMKDAARSVLQRNGAAVSQFQDATPYMGQRIRVKNDTGIDIEEYTAWRMMKPLWFAANDAISELPLVISLGAYNDQVTDGSNAMLAVVQEPLKAGAIGWAICSGSSYIKVDSIVSEKVTYGRPSSNGYFVGTVSGAELVKGAGNLRLLHPAPVTPAGPGRRICLCLVNPNEPALKVAKFDTLLALPNSATTWGRPVLNTTNTEIFTIGINLITKSPSGNAFQFTRTGLYRVGVELQVQGLAATGKTYFYTGRARFTLTGGYNVMLSPKYFNGMSFNNNGGFNTHWMEDVFYAEKGNELDIEFNCVSVEVTAFNSTTSAAQVSANGFITIELVQPHWDDAQTALIADVDAPP